MTVKYFYICAKNPLLVIMMITLMKNCNSYRLIVFLLLVSFVGMARADAGFGGDDLSSAAVVSGKVWTWGINLSGSTPAGFSAPHLMPNLINVSAISLGRGFV